MHNGGRPLRSYNSGRLHFHSSVNAIARGTNHHSRARANHHQARASKPAVRVGVHPMHPSAVLHRSSQRSLGLRGFPYRRDSHPGSAQRRSFRRRKHRKLVRVREPAINLVVKATSMGSKAEAASDVVATTRTPPINVGPGYQDYENAKPYERPQGLQRVYYVNVPRMPGMPDRSKRYRSAERVTPTATTQKSNASSSSTERSAVKTTALKPETKRERKRELPATSLPCQKTACTRIMRFIYHESRSGFIRCVSEQQNDRQHESTKSRS